MPRSGQGESRDITGSIDSYIAELILLAAAPCTAMVFVWSNRCDGEPHFTLGQVALDDVIMVFAFAPLVGLLLGFEPGAALATVVGVLIEVPVMLSVVKIVNATRPRYERGAAVRSGGPGPA